MRQPRIHLALALAAVALLPLAACHKGPWTPIDVWSTKPDVEVYPFGDTSIQVVHPRTMTLPAGGQMHAFEQLAGARLKWHTEIGPNAFFSFVPLGAEKPCACTYRMGVRKDGTMQELSKLPVQPMAGPTPAAVEIDMSQFNGQEVDLLLQIDGPTDIKPGTLPPSALWGNPMLYQKKTAAAPAS